MYTSVHELERVVQHCLRSSS